MKKLYFRYGAMNAGKTLALLSVAHNYEELGNNVLILKPSIDTKGKECITSRVGLSRKVDLLVSPTIDIKEWFAKIITSYSNTECILVDEAQFLTEAQVNQLRVITVYYDVPVICYGLRTDFRGDLFEGSKALLAIADSIEELKTVCKCKRKATYNARYINGKFTLDGNQVFIDGKVDVEYRSLCPECYLKEVNQYNLEKDF